MSVDAFCRLCYLLEQLGGLKDTKSGKEQVAIFLSILAHHTKNRVVKYNFKRSGRTISKHFHAVLNAVLKLHPVLLATPQPVTEDNTCSRWRWFKGCLGALDGTYIHVKVAEVDKGRYRNRKGDISVNVLGVCDRDLKFVYVLTGWRGSAADSRVLRDAINRPNGLKVGSARTVSYRVPWCARTRDEKAIPSSDIKADPHIQSKIHVWKKTYGSLVGMLGRSGFGWNDATNMVVVDDDVVWDNYIKIDPFAKNMRLKSFPFYPAWCEVFGKDRLRESMQKTLLMQQSLVRMLINAKHQTTTSQQWARQVGKKRKKGLTDLDARYIESIDRFVDKADMRLEMMSKRMGFEFDASEARKKVYEAISGLGGLQMRESYS
ncbi:UNVERIFIED_CONTAM: hypothetical protein Slati_2353700 [Sesamum latifolium]|uniref:Transposase n=1 Tax=Sesamum latifolium TaxID=2727402 RepID=A0AAW2WEI6_9LAMI